MGMCCHAVALCCIAPQCKWQAFTVGQELGCVVDAVCSGSGVAGNAAGGAAELVAELAGGP